ncbi:glycosyltransferase family 2 protein, partial [Selenomonas bovis]|nr:glycosyltransferase family 2 protein [Selenomonas bovis]
MSVIIPVYNVEEYLRECVESILHQDAPSMEILLIDDASTDSSAYIAEQLAKED